MARDRTRHLTKDMWPSWYYAPDGSGAIFNSASDVPDGWTRKKQAAYTVEKPNSVSKKTIVARLKQLNISIDPRWGTAKLAEVLKEYDDSSSR